MKCTNKYIAFTLVEMLVVMGIIVILMAVGIASGRFAIQRANKIEHQNAADQVYQGLQSYYADNREFPSSSEVTDFNTLVSDDLEDYIDEFDGGSEASYYYLSDITNQEVIVCVSLGGIDDVNNLGFYCTGNGFNTLSDNIITKEISSDDLSYADVYDELTGGTYITSEWNGSAIGWSGVESPHPPPASPFF